VVVIERVYNCESAGALHQSIKKQRMLLEPGTLLDWVKVRCYWPGEATAQLSGFADVTCQVSSSSPPFVW
jgi:hypothetical protein